MSKNVKQHQFLEVDEDLRRIGEREATKPVCPFGTKCYRKNPNHWVEYKHKSDSSANNSPKPVNKIGVKRGKITDFFVRTPTQTKKLLIEAPKEGSDYEIEDVSEDEQMNGSKHSGLDKPNTSTAFTPKRRKGSSFMTKIGSKTNSNHKKRGINGKTNDNEFGNTFESDLKAILKGGEIEPQLKPKNFNFNTKVKTSSSKKLKFESIKELKSKNVKELDLIESVESVEPTECVSEPTEESNESKTSNGGQMKPRLSPKQLNGVFKEIFLFEMPKDFFYLWQFCKNLKPEKPEDALVEDLGLRLVGPYDILTGRIKKSLIKDREQILCHSRYYYDLPEMQTIIASINSCYHLAYFRDTPEDDNPIVVSNNSNTSCVITGIGDNIFVAIFSEIQKLKSKETSNKCLLKLETNFKEFCNKNKISFNANTKLKERKSKINAKTFNGFGFVVPYDKKTEVGYRPLPETDTNLKKLLNCIMKVDEEVRSDCKSLMELQEIIQLVSYANDECDFGMGLELGIDLFCFGDKFFHKSILFLLQMAYDLLKREPFSRILRAHIHNRRKGFHLDSI